MEAPKNKAAVLTGPNTNPLDIRDVPMREPRPGYVVIKTAAVAIAPVDYVMQDSGMFLQDQDYPFILGCDVAGTVHASASDRFSSGERVMGHANAIFSHDMAEGAFQHYVLVSEELMAKIPDRMEFKDAVVLPLSITTAAAGLYPKDLLGLPHPSLGKALQHLEKLRVAHVDVVMQIRSPRRKLYSSGAAVAVSAAAPSNSPSPPACTF